MQAELMDMKGSGTHKDVACSKLSHTGLLGKTDALRELAVQAFHSLYHYLVDIFAQTLFRLP